MTAVDGLPLVLDEVRSAAPGKPAGDGRARHQAHNAGCRRAETTQRLTRDSRVVLDALSVLGETESELLAAVTGLDEATLSAAIHNAVSSTLLVPANTPLGVAWRHPLMRDAVRDLLAPPRAAGAGPPRRRSPHDQHVRSQRRSTTAGRRDVPAGRLPRPGGATADPRSSRRCSQRRAGCSPRAPGRSSCSDRHRPRAAVEVLIERIDTLTLAGRANDAYYSGVAALKRLSGRDAGPLLVATASGRVRR